MDKRTSLLTGVRNRGRSWVSEARGRIGARCVVMEPGFPPGERIRLYRRRIGLTQEQCAQLKGCTVSAWRKWESGERQVVAFADWIEIARILRVRDLYKLTGLPVSEIPEEP